MKLVSLLWVLFLAWAVSCAFYLFRIYKIIRSNRMPIFTPMRKLGTTSRVMVKKLYINILIATIILAVAVLIASIVSLSPS